MEDTSAPAGRANRSLPRLRRGRDKPQLSCNLCRRRKLRCDRRMPCENCARKGLSLSCTFPSMTGADPVSRDDQEQGHISSNLEAVHNKVDQLESLVISCMGREKASTTAGPNQTSPPAASSPGMTAERGSTADDISETVPSESFGKIYCDDVRTSYSEGSHWSAILDGIAGLKLELDNNHMHMGQNSLPGEDLYPDDLELLLGPCRYATKSEILAAIPSRAVVNRLILQYLQRPSIVRVLVHSPTFFKEYERFWINPTGVSLIWLGLLFAIMCVGAIAEQNGARAVELPLQYGSDSQHLIQCFREKLVQCLRLGKYTNGPPYTIETLLHYLHIEYLQTDDTQNGFWVLSGMIIRLALRMGYHRDGSHSSSISPFQAEMRRRAWAMIWHVDCMVSAQFSLPKMIQLSQFDTAEPRNLLDADFEPATQELPPSRPDTEQTTIQYLVTKNRLAAVFAQMSDLKVVSPHQSVYAQIMKLDKLLQDTYDAIPSGLKVHPLNPSTDDSPDAIMRQISLALSVQKSRCMLHRKYLLVAKADDESTRTSRMACVDAALETLRYQSFLFQQIQPGGCLHQHWKFSSLINQDFLLATTILCYDLDRNGHDRNRKFSDAESWQRSHVISALRTSYGIWLQSSASSEEARKVAQAIRLVLGKSDQARKQAAEEFSSDREMRLRLRTGGTSDSEASSSLGPPLLTPSTDSTPSLIRETGRGLTLASANSNSNTILSPPSNTLLLNNAPSLPFGFPHACENAPVTDTNGMFTGIFDEGTYTLDNTQTIDDLLDLSQQNWLGGLDFAM